MLRERNEIRNQWLICMGRWGHEKRGEWYVLGTGVGGCIALHCIALVHGLGERMTGLGERMTGLGGVADCTRDCVLGSRFWSSWAGVGRYTAFVQALWGIWVLAWHGFSLDSCTHDLHAGGSGLLLVPFPPSLLLTVQPLLLTKQAAG